ncbi:hypothetical protein ACFL5G_01650 [Candidatus Margulisiibacteriota bacterium]
MKKYFLVLLLLISFCQLAWAAIEISIEPVRMFHQEGHSVPITLKLKNTGSEPIEIPQYLVPYFDFDLEVKDTWGNEVNRSMSIYNLSYLKPVEQQILAPGDVYTQRINDLRKLYAIQKVGFYEVQALYFPDKDKKNPVISKPIKIGVGNVYGDHGFLIFSDTAYIQKGFCFSTMYPNADYFLREFTNNYFIFGVRSSWLQAGFGYSDGPYGGLKWQLFKENGPWPALGAQFFKWEAGREVLTSERNIRGYWAEDRGASYMLSKRLPGRAHLHLGVKRYETMTKLEGNDPAKNFYTFNVVGLDQSYDFGMLAYEADFDNVNNIKSEALMYRGFPSWEPQVGIGFTRYRPTSGREVTVLFISLYFHIDNYLLGYRF